MIGEHLWTLAVGRELVFAFKEAPNWHLHPGVDGAHGNLGGPH